ncbi:MULTISPECIES: BBE domain-containing protein [unclassified Nonomuraea]|uniref:BBE domain-containing protein n=1 Tax=unclassified Nonomuraea TaxID=2593643 RepID=UPI0033C6A03E
MSSARLVQPLRELGPEKDACAAMPYTRITEIYQDPRHPVSAHLHSALLRELDDDAAAELASFKARYDPDRLFRVNHNIAPAAQ